MTETIAGITVPDTTLVRNVTQFIRDTEDDLLYHHSRRVFFLGALQGQVRGLEPDLELLYTGAMFHDVGLTDDYNQSQLRFEVDSAHAARDFLLQHGVSADDARTVWLGIALHTTPGIPEFLDPVVALVTAGVETDVLGFDYNHLTEEQRDAVTAAHPRPDFKKRILRAFTEGNVHRSHTTFGNVNSDVLQHYMDGFVRDDFVRIILDSPWPE